MCPKEGDALWESVISTAGSKKNEDTSQRVLKEMYMNASTWQFKRQVLSILTQHMSLNEAQKVSRQFHEFMTGFEQKLTTG